jgi:hypothetical protein
MAIVKKISELTPKGSALSNTDLLVVGVDNGTDYDLKSVTGAQILGNVISQTITDGDTTHSPSSNVVFDSLALKVDKVTGKGLSTEDYTTAEKSKVASLSGTNTGDQTLQQVTDKGNITTQQLITNEGVKVQTLSSQVLVNINSNIAKTEGSIFIADTSGNSVEYKINEITKGANSILLPSSAGTLALTSELTSKVTSNTAITGATKTKITYDSKGLVTSGTDATTTDIADSLNYRYVTDAEKTKINYLNTVASNVQDQINSKVNLNSPLITPDTKTKITYDSKGLILSGSDATTADISDSLNKRYVTDANLTTIGNTSGTNTGDQDLSTYQVYATATTGSVISFIVPQVYNSVASPSTSNITDSLTSAKIGLVQKIYHNHTVAPTFPAGWVKMGTATYTTSTLNVIFAEWVSSTRVEYWITKPS